MTPGFLVLELACDHFAAVPVDVDYLPLTEQGLEWECPEGCGAQPIWERTYREHGERE